MGKTLEQWEKEITEAGRRGLGLEDILVAMYNETLEEAATEIEELAYRGDRIEMITARYNEGVQRAARLVRRRKIQKEGSDGNVTGG